MEKETVGGRSLRAGRAGGKYGMVVLTYHVWAP